MARLEVTAAGSGRTISNSRHVGRWMTLAWGICDKAQNDIWVEGMTAVSQVFGATSDKDSQLDEWARRSNGTLYVETLKPTFRSLIFGTAELKRIPRQVLQAASTYVPFLNLCQLLHIRMYGNATHTREGWVGHDWTECQIQGIRDFAVKVEDTICELVVEAMLKQKSLHGTPDTQVLDEVNRFTLHQRRFMGRKAILHIGVAVCYQSAFSDATSGLTGGIDKKRLPCPSWWFIFGGAKSPEHEEEPVAGFYFQWPSFVGFPRRPDSVPIFCLASTKSRDPSMSVPWHILQLPIDESIVNLIKCSLDFVGSAAPDQQPKSYRMLPTKSVVDFEAIAGEDSTEADTPTPERFASEEGEEIAMNEGEGPWEISEAEIEANGLAPIWDEPACEAWEKGHVLFYNPIKEHFVYYGYRCWLDEENEALYYWDAASTSYVYLDEDLHNSIAEGLVPCFPELIETEEPDAEYLTEQSDLEAAMTQPCVAVHQQMEGIESGAAVSPVGEVAELSIRKVPSMPRIEVSAVSAYARETPDKGLDLALTPRREAAQQGRLKSYTRGSIPETFRQLNPASGLLPVGAMHAKEDAGPLCKAAPKSLPQSNPIQSATGRSQQVQTIDFFRATDSSLFKRGVDFLQRIARAAESPELARWECRRDGSVKVGKQKRQLEGLMSGIVDAKSISAVDLSLMTGSLNLLNFHQIIMIRHHGSSTGAWDRASAESMKQFALKVDMMLSERLSQYLVDHTKTSYSAADASEWQLEKFNEMTASDKRYAGGQILFLLGSFMSASSLRDPILRSPPASEVLDVCLSSFTDKTTSWWFVPCHPIAGATLPKGNFESKPTGMFLGYPSLKVQIFRPPGPIYRLVRAQTTNIGGNNGWEVVLMVDQSAQ